MSLWCATYIAEETLEALPEDLHPAGRLLLQTIRSVIQTQQGTMADAASVFEATRAGRWTEAIDTFSYLASAASSRNTLDLSMVASMSADSYRSRSGGDRNAERRRHVRVIAQAISEYPWR